MLFVTWRFYKYNATSFYAQYKPMMSSKMTYLQSVSCRCNRMSGGVQCCNISKERKKGGATHFLKLYQTKGNKSFSKKAHRFLIFTNRFSFPLIIRLIGVTQNGCNVHVIQTLHLTHHIHSFTRIPFGWVSNWPKRWDFNVYNTLHTVSFCNSQW